MTHGAANGGGRTLSAPPLRPARNLPAQDGLDAHPPAAVPAYVDRGAKTASGRYCEQ